MALKIQCEQEHERLLRQMMEILISHYWVVEEARKAGVTLTRAEINRALHLQFPQIAEFRRWLAYTRLQPSDEKFTLEGELLLEKWRESTLPVFARLHRDKGPETMQMAGEVDDETTHLAAALTKRWTAKTSCRSGYLVPFCSESRGSPSDLPAHG
jgi:hypothetical protein